ncbi:MAG: hypothetical protein RLZZ522_201, partial [Verrucomicrobiota bacterium]
MDASGKVSDSIGGNFKAVAGV